MSCALKKPIVNYTNVDTKQALGYWFITFYKITQIKTKPYSNNKLLKLKYYLLLTRYLLLFSSSK